ncbi:MAG: hypothetical protein HC811_09150 [Flammeovirgaceae bacterium]|nr:hypothetical protein [Flammeovirgaceae bacterium]
MRKFGKWSLFILIDLIILILLVAGPIDRTELDDQPFYQSMMKELDSLHFTEHGSDSIRIGWQRIPITPNHNMPMAGYRPRDSFDSVHDSLYARVISLENNSSRIYLVSIDLLIFPPILKEKLEEALSLTNKPFYLFLSATHTHNGVGGWDESLLGHFSVGDFDEGWINDTAAKITLAMQDASLTALNGTIAYKEWNASHYVSNRLAAGASKDGMLRGLQFEQGNGDKALLMTYSGHPTNISKGRRELSGDYPAVLVNRLESEGYNFAVFMAGMVGSHQIANVDGNDFELCENIGSVLMESKKSEGISEELSSRIKTASIQIMHGPSQVRIGKNWKIRDWVFSAVSQPLQGELSVVSIGDVLLIGTPVIFQVNSLWSPV